ncbi:MAG: hypothetical protein GX094_11605 [Clostridiales bacterium]|jgi:hypothetical protein|nr:hypothetical protein [Clostridiales bacterium]
MDEIRQSLASIGGVDALHRRLPMADDVGPLRKNRYVGMFYFLWNGEHTTDGPYDITEILKQHPDAPRDYNHPAWGGEGHMYHWGRPLFGYYFSRDPWVIRKHIEMLTIAGIDFLFFDTTNRHTYPEVVEVLLEWLDKYRMAGWPVPKIVYYTNTKSGETIQEVYEFLYKPGRYKDLWFYWDGKPLIIGHPDECSDEVREFFTIRQSQWPNEPPREWGWPWMDFERPQRVWRRPDGTGEVINVSVAQHPQIFFGDSAFYGETANRGRSFHDGQNDFAPGAVNWGYNFSEQWERAREADPEVVLVTGWNEWIAGRFHGTKERPVRFVDTASQEFSRDIEPMKDGHFDNYYMQLVAEVRRYKGMEPLPQATPRKKIDLSDSFGQWRDVGPAYRDMPFGNLHREHVGYGGVIYRDVTGRNAFDTMKVARDDENIYFYVKTEKPIVYDAATPWMWLLFGFEGREYAPNWEGYQYIVNNIVLDNNTTVLQSSLGGFRWGKNAPVKYRMEGNEMHIAVPRACVGLKPGQPFRMYFKWADNTGSNENIEDFYLHGDTAPYGRFYFVYEG